MRFHPKVLFSQSGMSSNRHLMFFHQRAAYGTSQPTATTSISRGSMPAFSIQNLAACTGRSRIACLLRVMRSSSTNAAISPCSFTRHAAGSCQPAGMVFRPRTHTIVRPGGSKGAGGDRVLHSGRVGGDRLVAHGEDAGALGWHPF